MLKLFRGEQELGELAHRFERDRPGLLGGVLRPSARFAETEGIMQVRVRIAPGHPVFVLRESESAGSGRHSLRKQSPRAAGGLPEGQQLRVVADSGRDLKCDFISLRPELAPSVGLVAVCAAQGLEGTIWLLTANQDPGGATQLEPSSIPNG